ncbi:MAG: NIPSNAP family protein [Candidatus Protistobacter heckmanni]|nr:NIPSNAP family protein [Candidatus Protistobacter heckmanni]
MLHELRIYHCMPRRLPDLSRRFKEHTLALSEKHGIRPVAFWTTLIGPDSNLLYYILEWQSLAERETRWNAFLADSVWQETRAKTEANGALVARMENMILSPTSYSPLR